MKISSKESLQKYVLIGDMGGHASCFEDILRQHGCNPDTGMVPLGTVVIQVGDLIRLSLRRGQESDKCVSIAQRMMQESGSRWIQLLGNHELGVLGGPLWPTWENKISDQTTVTLRNWWYHRRARLAVALCDVDGREVLVSHAGLTFGDWFARGSPRAPEYTQMLDSVIGMKDVTDPRTTPSLGHVPISSSLLGPSCLMELYPSWHAINYAPFDQVHGHSSPIDWNTGRLHASYGAQTRPCDVDIQGRVVKTRVALTTFTSIDWVLSDRPYVGSAYVLYGREGVLSDVTGIVR